MSAPPARACDRCQAPPFRWLLDLYRHLVDVHGIDAHQLPTPRPIR